MAVRDSLKLNLPNMTSPAVIAKSDKTPVKNDGVIKEQIRTEYETSRQWNEKWDFLENFDEICLQIAREKGISEEEYRRMAKKPKANTSQTNVAGWRPPPSGSVPKTTSEKVNSELPGSASVCLAFLFLIWKLNVIKEMGENSARLLRLKDLLGKGEIGWRSSKVECGLEIFGPLYVSDRLTIDPPGEEPFKQNYIILG